MVDRPVNNGPASAGSGDVPRYGVRTNEAMKAGAGNAEELPPYDTRGKKGRISAIPDIPTRILNGHMVSSILFDKGTATLDNVQESIRQMLEIHGGDAEVKVECYFNGMLKRLSVTSAEARVRAR